MDVINDDWKDLARYARPSYKDTPIEDPRFDDPDWTVELKQDGMYGIMSIDNGVGFINGRIDGMGDIPKGIITVPSGFQVVLLGEYMFGSNWAIRHNLVEHYYAFDLLFLDGHDLRALPLSARRYYLTEVFRKPLFGHEKIHQVEVWPAADRMQLWQKYVKGDDFEGVVLKNRWETFFEATWHRHKLALTMDYICLGMTEGEGKHKGRMGALIGGLYVDGELKTACSVGGGFTDEQRIQYWANKQGYIGQVFEARGWKLFPSGALRHPNFLRWRDDKYPEDCRI